MLAMLGIEPPLDRLGLGKRSGWFVVNLARALAEMDPEPDRGGNTRGIAEIGGVRALGHNGIIIINGPNLQRKHP